MRVNRFSLIVAFGLAFGVGVYFGSGRFPFSGSSSAQAESEEHSDSAEYRTRDNIKLGASSAVHSMIPPSSASTPINLFNEKERASLEAYLRGVPYSVLKQIYFERQDAEFEKVNERYSSGKDLTEEEQAQRAEALFEGFQRGSGVGDYYAETEWKMRGGRTVPVRLFAKFYSSRPTPNGADTTVGAPSEARTGYDLCWTLTLYMKVSEKFAMDSTSTCLPWTSVRDQAPFAVLQANSKPFIPYFDSISIPLPGFSSDAPAAWLDSAQNRWTSLSGLHWEPKERAEVVHLEKDLQTEVVW